MIAWLTALAVLGCAAALLTVEQVVGRAEAAWVRAVAPPPPADSELDDDQEFDLEALDEIPLAIRGRCPEPPFAALVYHHTCGSCRAMWKEVRQSDDLAEVHMVHSDDDTEMLRRKGLLREPAVALPAELMATLPSGLLLRVDSGWRLAEVHMATTVAEVRDVLHAAVARS